VVPEMPRRLPTRSGSSRLAAKPAVPTKAPRALAAKARQLKKTDRQIAFLAAWERFGTMSAACRETDVPRSLLYNTWLKEPTFAELAEGVKDRIADSLEQEAIRRGRDGWLEPVFYKGDEVGEIRKFSDLLVIFMLKALRPDKYRERTNVQHEGTVVLEQVLAASRTPAAAARLRATTPGGQDA